MSLRTALRANAAFSGLSGVVLVVGSSPISSFLGVGPGWILIVVGLGLVGYAVQLLVFARRNPVDQGEVMFAVGADLAWVVGSGVLVAWGPLTDRGEVLVVALALVVLAFGLLQAFALRRES